MKTESKTPTLDDPGSVKLTLDHQTDPWKLFNLISKGDEVIAYVSRKTTAGRSQRLTVKVLIKIESKDLDDGTGKQLIRLSGIISEALNSSARENVSLGQHQNVEYSVGDTIILKKESWSAEDIEQYVICTTSTFNSNYGCIIMEPGTAYICELTQTTCPTLLKITKSIPKKQKINNAYEKAIASFFRQICEAFERNIIPNPEKLHGLFYFSSQALFTSLQEYIQQNHRNLSWMIKIGHFQPILQGSKHEVIQLLSSGKLKQLLLDASNEIENKMMSLLLTELNSDRNTAFFGLDNVLDHSDGIDKLMMNKTIAETSDSDLRFTITQLISKIEEQKGEILIIDDNSQSGMQLHGFGDIACITKYSVVSDKVFHYQHELFGIDRPLVGEHNTYLNNSDHTLQSVVQFLGISPEQILERKDDIISACSALYPDTFGEDSRDVQEDTFYRIFNYIELNTESKHKSKKDKKDHKKDKKDHKKDKKSSKKSTHHRVEESDDSDFVPEYDDELL